MSFNIDISSGPCVCVCVRKKEKENEKNKEILLAFKDEMMGEFHTTAFFFFFWR